MRVFSKFSYQKLRQEVIFQEQDDNQHLNKKYPKFDVIRRSLSTRRGQFIRLRSRRLRLKIAGFRKLFKIRRVKVGRLSWAKFVKRFKESQSHFGDLFSGNYLFMQVTPASFNNKPYLAHHNHHHNLNYHLNHKLHAFPSSRFNNFAVQKVA